MSLLRSARELPEYWQVLRNLVARDLKVKYQSGVLGFAWSLLYPAILLGIWYLVFRGTGIIRMPAYWAYLLSGMLVFQFLNVGILEGAAAVRHNAGIVRKVYVPLEILVIAGVTVKLVEFLLQLGVALLFLAFLHHGEQVGFSPLKALIVLPGAIVLVYLFALGVALPLAGWTVIYRDLEHILTLALTALFYLTPVFWAMPMMSGRKYFHLIALNPAADLLELFHGPLYWGRWPENLAIQAGPLGAWTLASVYVAVIFICGYGLFDRSKRILAEVV